MPGGYFSSDESIQSMRGHKIHVKITVVSKLWGTGVHVHQMLKKYDITTTISHACTEVTESLKMGLDILFYIDS